MSNKKIIYTFLGLFAVVLGIVVVFEKDLALKQILPITIKDITLKPPSRAAYEGCKWEEVNGIGLKLWGMRCGDMYVTTYNDTQTANLVEMSSSTIQKKYDYITVYDIKNGNINDVLPLLAKDPKWNADDNCVFSEGKKKDGKMIYTMRPTGDALTSLEAEEKDNPINEVCGGYGVSNDSGIRYFEVHDSNPNKALFLFVGQDAPMYDEQTIEVLK